MGVVVGIDEVGRGCWAGPLVAAAVILDHNFNVSKEAPWKLGDSKLLTRRQREMAEVEIWKVAEAIGVGWVSAKEIDDTGLTASTRLAMQAALSQIAVPYDEIIIDGHYNFLAGSRVVQSATLYTVVEGDKTVPPVSAASIVAKVARDNYMRNAGKAYARYQFDKHVGYGTKLHRDLLKLHGICDLHRRSYKPVQALLSQQAV